MKMGYKFDDYRDRLYSLFKYLNNKYEIKKDAEISLHVFPEETGRSGGSLFIKEESDVFIYDIFVFLNESEKNIDPIKIEIKHPLPYFQYILLHEYGHFRYMELIRQDFGKDTMYKELEEYYEDKEKLEKWAKTNGIPAEKEEKMYREIKFEKKADDFALYEYSVLE